MLKEWTEGDCFEGEAQTRATNFCTATKCHSDKRQSPCRKGQLQMISRANVWLSCLLFFFFPDWVIHVPDRKRRGFLFRWRRRSKFRDCSREYSPFLAPESPVREKEWRDNNPKEQARKERRSCTVIPFWEAVIRTSFSLPDIRRIVTIKVSLAS